MQQAIGCHTYCYHTELFDRQNTKRASVTIFLLSPSSQKACADRCHTCRKASVISLCHACEGLQVHNIQLLQANLQFVFIPCLASPLCNFASLQNMRFQLCSHLTASDTCTYESPSDSSLCCQQLKPDLSSPSASCEFYPAYPKTL